MKSTSADRTVFSMSPRRDRRKYLSWERSNASSSSCPRRRSWSLSAAERPSSSEPRIVFDVVASTRVSRLLRRRFTDVCRRSRRHRHSSPRHPCKMDGSPTASSTLLRRAQSAAASSDYGTRPQQCSVLAADPRPPPGTTSTTPGRHLDRYSGDLVVDDNAADH